MKKKHDDVGTHHFQDQWATMLPWAKSIVNETGNVHKVQCVICMKNEEKEICLCLSLIICLSMLVGTKPGS
jgi:hypothetical protein